MATPPKKPAAAASPARPAAAAATTPARPSAAAAATPARPAEASADPRKKKRRKLIPAVLVVLLAASGGGGWFYLQHKNADAGTAAVPEKKKPPVFLTIDQFTVNLTGAGGDHFLQVAFALQLTDAKVADEIKAQMPIVRGRLLMLLASKTAEELGTTAGKQKLMTEILTEARAPLSNSETGKSIESVHFSAFVIQ